MLTTRASIPSSVDHVLGVYARDHLGAALAAVHRSGYGPQARVFDGARGDVTQQLSRAGLRVHDASSIPAEALLIAVNAPGRAAMVAELFSELGAEAVIFASKRDDERTEMPRQALLTPDVRISD